MVPPRKTVSTSSARCLVTVISTTLPKTVSEGLAGAERRDFVRARRVWKVSTCLCKTSKSTRCRWEEEEEEEEGGGQRVAAGGKGGPRGPQRRPGSLPATRRFCEERSGRKVTWPLHQLQ
eukprot:scaffold11666_cov199-Ochromonas_danica.AAC.6